jgi:hypothetical protein
MATLTTTTTIQGRINGKSVSITLTSTITGVTHYLDRSGRLPFGGTMQSLNESTPLPPTIDNTQIAYVRFDSFVGPGGGVVDAALDTVALASEGRFPIDQGRTVELYRSEAGGIFAENNTATTSVLEIASRMEQSASSLGTTNTGLFVAFKPIS